MQCSSEPGSPRLSLFTPDGTLDVVHLQFTTDTDMEEWQNYFATVCGTLQQSQGESCEDFYIF